MIELLGIDVFHRGSREFEAVLASADSCILSSPNQPDLVVRPRTDAEVAIACAYAVSHGQRPGILNLQPALHTRPGGMLLDLSHLKRVSVDPVARIALVESSATAQDIMELLVEHAPLGLPVRSANQLIHSGFLPRSPAWVATDQSVRGVDLVTWDGTRLHLAPGTHAELFATVISQAQPSPGIVTRVHLAIEPLPAVTLVAVHRYPLSALQLILRWLDHSRSTFPVGLELSVLTTPDEGPDHGGYVRLMGISFGSSMASAVEALSLLERSPLLADAIIVEPTTATTLDVLVDRCGYQQSHECGEVVRAEWLPDTADAAENWASSRLRSPLSLTWWRDPTKPTEGSRAFAMHVARHADGPAYSRDPPAI